MPKLTVARALLLAIALGALLRLPVLLTPFVSDDYQQIAMLRGEFVLKRAAWDLFWFGPRDDAEMRALQDFGFDPWWTAPDHRLSMLRPLASLLIALDHGLFGLAPVPFHLHSLAWWIALVASAAWLFRSLLPERAASVAMLLYALHVGHNVPLSWLANRSTLLASTFGVLGLVLHLRARGLGTAPKATRGRPQAVASVLCFAASLAAGEYGLGLLGYLLAFEWLYARDPWRVRARALLPAAAVTLLYLGLRAGLGYGVAGSGLYVGPGDTAAFAKRFLMHVPVLAANLVLGVPTHYFGMGPPWRDPAIAHGLLTPALFQVVPSWRATHVVIGVLAIGLAVAAVRRLAPRARGELGACTPLAFGSLLALFAVSGVEPSARLLGGPALGACALVAAVVVRAAESTNLRPRVRAALLGLVALGHGLSPAWSAYAQTAEQRREAEATKRFALRADIPQLASDVDVVIVSASDFATAANLPWIRLVHGLPLPRSYRRLSGALQAHDLVRVDDHTLELEVLSSDVTGAFAGSIYRRADEVFLAGAHFELPRMAVDVLAVDAGNPWRLRFRFEQDLDDPKLIFLHARPMGLQRIRIPPRGQTLRLPQAALPWLRAAD